MTSQPELWHSALSPRQLVPRTGCSPAAPRALHLPSAVPWWGFLKHQLQCRGWALTITEPGGLEGFLWSKDNMEIHTTVQKNQRAFAQLGLQILCGRGKKERKTAFIVQTQPGSVLFMFILIHYLTLIFFEYCKSPLKTVFQNSTLKPRISALSVTTHQTINVSVWHHWINLSASFIHRKMYLLFFSYALYQCQISAHQSQWLVALLL